MSAESNAHAAAHAPALADSPPPDARAAAAPVRPVKVRRPGGRFLFGSTRPGPEGEWVVVLPAGVRFEPGEAVEVLVAGPTTTAVVRRSTLQWARVTRSLAFHDAVHLVLRIETPAQSQTPGVTEYAKAG